MAFGDINLDKGYIYDDNNIENLEGLGEICARSDVRRVKDNTH